MSATANSGEARRLQLFTRSREVGFAVSWADANGAATSGGAKATGATGFLHSHAVANASVASEPGFAATGAQYNRDGTLLCCWGVVPVATSQGGDTGDGAGTASGSRPKAKRKEEGRIFIIDTETGELKSTIKPAAGEGDMRHIFGVEFSPLSNHLLVHERFVKNLPQGNVSVWCIRASGERSSASLEPRCLERFYERRFSKAEPALQWTGDESAAGHLVKNQVQFYAYENVASEEESCSTSLESESKSKGKFAVSGRVGVQGAVQASVAPSSGRRGYHFACFKPDAKGKPGQVRCLGLLALCFVLQWPWGFVCWHAIS